MSGLGSAAAPAATPIGMFDSGVGGLTVARAVIDQLPAESLIYVGDTAVGPYGPLPQATVRERSLAIADSLVQRGIKLLVIACNTATAASVEAVRARYDIPVIEVITPAVRRATATTHTGRIGVIGTSGTIASGAYQHAFAAVSDATITAAACPRFVDFVERGVTSGRHILGLAEAYLAPLRMADVDTLVLGCTHYPLLSGVLQLAVGDHVTLVSSAEETAKDVLATLTHRNLLRPPAEPPVREFLATGDAQRFAHLAIRFLGPGLGRTEHVAI